MEKQEKAHGSASWPLAAPCALFARAAKTPTRPALGRTGRDDPEACRGRSLEKTAFVLGVHPFFSPTGSPSGSSRPEGIAWSEETDCVLCLKFWVVPSWSPSGSSRPEDGAPDGMCENVRKCAEMCALTDGLAPQLASDPVAFFAEK